MQTTRNVAKGSAMASNAKNRVFVIGVGMTKFEKPGRREGWDYPQMAKESGTKALADAGIDYTEVEQGYVGYCSGDSTSGQRALYELGMTGIPIVNVNNNCSTGSTALYLAAQSIRGGLADCVIALGFEKMQPGSLAVGADDRESPLGNHVKALAEIDEARLAHSSRRETLAAALAPDLSALYERQRAGGGPGAGQLLGHRCGSCRIEIDKGELARISAAPEDDLVRCPECGAILLRVKGFGQ